jgi:hypothetical protein
LIVVFLFDYCLTHHCHCSTNAIANAAINATAATHRPPKPPSTLDCCCFKYPTRPRQVFLLDAGRQRISGQKWEHCLIFGWLVCCEPTPLYRHQKLSHELIMRL